MSACQLLIKGRIVRADFEDEVVEHFRYDIFAGLARFHGGLAILGQPLYRIENVVLLEGEGLVGQTLDFALVSQLQPPQLMQQSPSQSIVTASRDQLSHLLLNGLI